MSGGLDVPLEDEDTAGNDRFSVPAQPVNATHALNLSAGVSKSKVFRGRSFN